MPQVFNFLAEKHALVRVIFQACASQHFEYLGDMLTMFFKGVVVNENIIDETASKFLTPVLVNAMVHSPLEFDWRVLHSKRHVFVHHQPLSPPKRGLWLVFLSDGYLKTPRSEIQLGKELG